METAPTPELTDDMPPSTITKPSRPLTNFVAFVKVTSEWFMSHTANFWIMLYIAVVIIAAQVTLAIKPIAGVYVNAGAFAALIGLGLWKERARMLTISASILPVSNMISLSLPQTSVFAQTTVFYDSLLLLALVYRFIFTLDEPVQTSRLSLKGYGRLLPIASVIGEVFGVIGYILLRHHYTFGHTALPLVAASAVVFAIAEETFFRGLIQQRASQFMSPVLAILLSVSFYVFTSIDHITILVPLFALASGLVLSYVYYKKQNLLLTITLNAATKLVYIGLMAGFIFR